MIPDWRRISTRIWTLPNTLLGLGIGVFGLCLGGQAQRVQGCLEFHGGAIARLLNSIPPGQRFSALTLGHVILGLDADVLVRVRRHEHVHVRQYERWGPFFLPAYAACSLWIWISGGAPYRGNPFEVQAYAVDEEV